MKQELVDILIPPLFTRSKVVKPRDQAWADGDWIATFNLWIARTQPEPSILFQERSARSSFAPLKLDIAAGGHYSAGETGLDGLREAEEELGKTYDPNNVTFLGKRAYIGNDTKGRLRQNIVYVYCTIDNAPLSSFKLDPVEVNGLYTIPISQLIRMYKEEGHEFSVEGVNLDKRQKTIKVTIDSFINADWDDYKYKTIRAIRDMINGKEEVYI